jgi:anti-anti-sigma factor
MSQPSIKSSGLGSGNSVRAAAFGTSLNVYVEGRFDFNCHQEFRRAYESATGTFVEYVVDLKATEYIDSAALGMLLVLRESVGAAKVRIANSRPAVRKILQIANFDSLFAID